MTEDEKEVFEQIAACSGRYEQGLQERFMSRKAVKIARILVKRGDLVEGWVSAGSTSASGFRLPDHYN